MAYAVETRVPVDQTQREIRKTLERYGATSFMFGEQGPLAVCAFEMKGRRIRFNLEMPVHGKFLTKKRYIASKEQVAQRTRSLWRALLLAIKAKLECAAITPQLESSYKTGAMPPLLGPGVMSP